MTVGYIQTSLIPGETIKQRARHHWILIFTATFWTLVIWTISLVLIAVSPLFGEWASKNLAHDGSAPPEKWFMFGLAGLGALIILLRLWGYISFWIWLKSTEYAVTNHRVIMKSGLIRRNTYEVMLKQLETVGVHQGIRGRILGYGTMSLTATGGSHGSWQAIAYPMIFKKHVEAAMHVAQGGSPPSGPAPTEPAPPTDTAPAPEPVAPEPVPVTDNGPGTFRVSGVDKETSADIDMVIDANSAANAKVKAELEGMIVTDVARVVDEAHGSATEGQQDVEA